MTSQTPKKQTQNKANQTQFVVSKVEPSVMSLPALSAHVLSVAEVVEGHSPELVEGAESIRKKPGISPLHRLFLSIFPQIFSFCPDMENQNKLLTVIVWDNLYNYRPKEILSRYIDG